MPKIMVVDDDPAGQRLIKYMLTPEGHEVITASNGITGLQMATQQSPDLVILDVMLPGLDGFEVCRRLREGSSTANISIVMLSGKAQASDRDTGLKMGADEYLIKPVDRQELIEVINKLLSEKTGPMQQRQAKIFSFIGVRGGAGTSTLTTNVSVVLAEQGHSTILVDLSPSFSTIADIIGLKVERSAAGLFKETSGVVSAEGIRELLVQHGSGVKLLWGDVFPEESGSISRENIDTLLQEAANMAEYVIVDLPASPPDQAIAALAAADSVILVTGAAKESLDRIDNSITRLSRLGVNKDKLNLVLVNKAGTIDIGESSPESVAGVSVLGVIHNGENECSDAEAKSTPVVTDSPSSRIAEDIRNLTSKLAASG